MKILIAGGTGMIGKEIVNVLQAEGHTVKLLTRQKSLSAMSGITFYTWDPQKMIFPLEALHDTDAIINLSGAGIVDKRWRTARKQELIDSRVMPLQCIKHALTTHTNKIQHIISASAIGYYGNSGDTWVNENSTPANEEFLVECCRLWEQATQDLKSVCPVVSIIRIGVVLHHYKGAYPKLVNPIRYGIMPLLGGGNAVYSWIHIADISGITSFILKNKLDGIFNAVAPQPVSLKALLKAFANNNKSIYIPIFVPAFVLKFLLGKMSAAVLNSNKVSCEKVISRGFKFQYNTIQLAIHDLEHN